MRINGCPDAGIDQRAVYQESRPDPASHCLLIVLGLEFAWLSFMNLQRAPFADRTDSDQASTRQERFHGRFHQRQAQEAVAVTGTASPQVCFGVSFKDNRRRLGLPCPRILEGVDKERGAMDSFRTVYSLSSHMRIVR